MIHDLIEQGADPMLLTVLSILTFGLGFFAAKILYESKEHENEV